MVPSKRAEEEEEETQRRSSAAFSITPLPCALSVEHRRLVRHLDKGAEGRSTRPRSNYSYRFENRRLEVDERPAALAVREARSRGGCSPGAWARSTTSLALTVSQSQLLW